MSKILILKNSYDMFMVALIRQIQMYVLPSVVFLQGKMLKKINWFCMRLYCKSELCPTFTQLMVSLIVIVTNRD